MEKKYVIYKIVNKENGKVYIGATCDFTRRKNDHLSMLRRGKHQSRLQYDFKEGVYIFEVITKCSEEEKDVLEKFWISVYESNKEHKGYNKESGGNKGKKLAEETRLNKSYYMKKRDLTYDKHPMAKKVIRINDGVIFNCIKLAAESIGVSGSAISAICNGRNKCTLGFNDINYQFAYYEEGKEYKLKEVDTSNHKKPKKVLCLNNDMIYESTKEASRELNLLQSKVSLVCNGKRNHTGGYKFKFIN